MTAQTEEALVPVVQKRAQAEKHAPLPDLSVAHSPARVYIDAALSVIREQLPWGEVGAQFLKGIFLDSEGQTRKVFGQEIVGYCIAKAPEESPNKIAAQVTAVLDRLVTCGLVLVEQSPIIRTQYYLNPTPGVLELLGMKEHDGIKVLERREQPFDAEKAKGFLEEGSFGYPFKAEIRGVDIASRLNDRKMFSALFNDDSLYEVGAMRGFSLRSNLTHILNSGIAAGVLKFEVVEKERELREVYSVTDAAKLLVSAIAGIATR